MSGSDTTRIAVLANCTVHLLPDLLKAELAARGVATDFWTAGFNQYRQEIMDPGSELYRFQPDVVIVYLDGEDLFPDVLADPFDASGKRGNAVAAAAGEIEALLQIATARLAGTVFILNTIPFPPRHALTGLEFNSAYSLYDIPYRYDAAIVEIAAALKQIVIVDAAGLAAWIGYKHWRDSRMWYLARSRWSRTAAKALARSYADACSAYWGKSRKCIVLDLDNTMWGGVIGEEGLAGIQLGEEGIGLAFAEFQDELKRLLPKGILLAVCSKNNPEDALEVFRKHPAMRLKEEDFACLRINWEDKAANLTAIAEELNIGMDSLVFVDDNPAERERIRGSLPQVHVPDWPEDPTDYRGALVELAAEYFPKLRITEEDRSRSSLYQAQAARRQLAGGSAGLPDFYRSLEMTATIGRADDLTIPRIAQLTQKTNQFNLTTRRYTEAEIRVLSERADTDVLWMDLRDRFGSNGIIAAMILQHAASSCRIDTLLMSCRVIGRTAENTLLGVACRLAAKCGAEHLIGEYRPSERNGVAASLYRTFGFEAAGEEKGAQLWQLNLRSQSVPVSEWIRLDSKVEARNAGQTIGSNNCNYV